MWFLYIVMVFAGFGLMDAADALMGVNLEPAGWLATTLHKSMYVGFGLAAGYGYILIRRSFRAAKKEG